MSLLLSIDCGTQSLRALIFDLNGKLLAKSQIFYKPYESPQPGFAEQDADVYWNALTKAVKQLKKDYTDLFDRIKGMSVTTLRATMVNVDKDGNPLRPAIVWLDERKAEPVYKPGFFTDKMFRIAGMRKIIEKLQRDGKSNWLKQNQTEIWGKTHKYLQISGYLNYKLTGKFVDSIASQIGYIPFDYKRQKWANPSNKFVFSAKLFPIEKQKLPELVPSGSIIGEITGKAATETGLPKGLPVIASGSDKGCETLGCGVTDASSVALSFGTTATVQTTVEKYMEPLPFFPSYPSVIAEHWNPEIEIFRGFWLVNWFKNEFAHKEQQEAKQRGIPTEKVLDELLHKSPPGAMGLTVQPYWTSGIAEKHAKGAIIGFGDVHKKEHVYRALIEGLIYALRDGTERLKKRGKMNFEKIIVAGGGSQSDEVCKITADIFNRKVYRSQTFETSGLGAAIVSSVALGFYKNIRDAINNMVSYPDIFEPDTQNVKLYVRLYKEVYLKIYKTLEPLNKKIKEITSYPKF